jgi:hypothetical protein
MKTSLFLTTALVVVMFSSSAYGQGMAAPSQGTPRITHIMPLGGQAGTTFELKVTGQDITEVEGLHFNFPGVKVETTSNETVPIDKKVKGKGKAKTPAPLNLQKFKVTLPASAPLGIQDVRIVTKQGISNPRAFVVSDHKEFGEEEPNDDVPKAQRIELNSTVNGVIAAPTDVDYYVFTGKKGQRVVCSALTTSIDSRLNALIQLYGEDGGYLGSNRNYARNDALLDAVLPADGDYYVRVCSFTYTQGGVDYFYRLSVSTAPWIDAIFPSIVEPGKETKVTVYGRNLPGGKLDPNSMVNDRALEKTVVTVKASSDPLALQRLAHAGLMTPVSSMLDGFDYRLKNDAGQSNPFLLTYASAPVVLDNGDNDEQEKAQQIPVPSFIAGRIEKKADRDWYAFEAKKGQVINIEAFSERLGVETDLYFQLRNEKGTLIVEQDDTAEILSPHFYTANKDPQKYRFAPTADGTYYLMVSSRGAFTDYGPRNIYTVHIAPEEPDFRLIAMPTSPLAPEGNHVNQAGGAAFTVFIWRLGNFNSEITISGDNLPQGVSVKPQVISSGQKQAVIVVHADSDAKRYAGAIKFVGSATFKGQKLLREVRSATITWPVAQAATPTITRLDRELVLAVRDKAPYSLVVSAQKISVIQGAKISIPVKVVGSDKFKGNVQVTAIGGPTGLNSPAVSIAPGQGGTVSLDAKGGMAFAPGNYTIFVRGQTQPINLKQPAPKGTPPNIVQISMPVSLTIVPKQLGKLSVPTTTTKVARGKTVEITVKFARQYDLPLALKVEAILPPNLKGVIVEEANIKENEDETRIVFSVAPNATIGTTPQITIRATAMFNGTVPVVHETKVSLNITK